uniref:Uncharacterized protein n=1 Tax=Cacopsylla melanoneura TaxID=428564 RepID=A0A8D8ZYE6_9HEMI
MIYDRDPTLYYILLLAGIFTLTLGNVLFDEKNDLFISVIFLVILRSSRFLKELILGLIVLKGKGIIYHVFKVVQIPTHGKQNLIRRFLRKVPPYIFAPEHRKKF